MWVCIVMPMNEKPYCPQGTISNSTWLRILYKTSTSLNKINKFKYNESS